MPFCYKPSEQPYFWYSYFRYSYFWSQRAVKVTCGSPGHQPGARAGGRAGPPTHTHTDRARGAEEQPVPPSSQPGCSSRSPRQGTGCHPGSGEAPAGAGGRRRTPYLPAPPHYRSSAALFPPAPAPFRRGAALGRWLPFRSLPGPRGCPPTPLQAAAPPRRRRRPPRPPQGTRRRCRDPPPRPPQAPLPARSQGRGLPAARRGRRRGQRPAPAPSPRRCCRWRRRAAGRGSCAGDAGTFRSATEPRRGRANRLTSAHARGRRNSASAWRKPRPVTQTRLGPPGGGAGQGEQLSNEGEGGRVPRVTAGEPEGGRERVL